MTLDRMSNNFSAMPNEQMLFENALCARVKRLREEKEWTAEQMAIALGVPPERYRKYENRSPMPQYLIPRFALVVDRSVEYVLTGKEPRSLTLAKPAYRKIS
ncbi:MAG: helix-turn-helix transcriptional regulator [Hyphomicrobium sp.]|uniref:helix-turn-helix domain-containing protein n=1 Tax=Hyphomicrobium sp. TaxID=82 RepID=UPI0035664FF6